MKKLALLILAITFSFVSIAAESQLLVAKGNKAYADGQYQEAVDAYLKVLQTGSTSWELYYNLGNSYYKLNEFPSAILYYERAKKLNPGNADIDFNLKVSNNKIADKIEPLPEMFYKKWFRAVVELFSVDQWSWVVIFSLWMAIAGASIYVVTRRLLLRKVGFWLSIASVILFVVSFRFAWVNYQTLQSNSEAIIFAPTVTVKSSPDDKSTDLFVVHEGTKVEILDAIGTWYEIQIANGSVGWLPSSAVERI